MLSPHLESLVESKSPDWSTVSLEDVHHAIHNLVGDLMNDRRSRKDPDVVAERKQLGGYVRILAKVKASKWADRGPAALIDAIQRTHVSLRKTDRMGIFAQLYLDDLIAEGKARGILAEDQDDSLRSPISDLSDKAD